MLNGGTLGGTGIVATITATGGGGLSPGSSPGRLNSSNLTLNASSTLFIEINGTNAGIDYDQLNVSGSVNTGGAQLHLSNTVAAQPGTTFVIIANDSTDAVTNTFFNLPEGSLITNGPAVFRISYQGGDGNDVTLTVPLPPSPPSTITSLSNITNGFKLLTGQGQANLTYTILANTNVNTTNWIVLGTAPANGSGAFAFVDTNAPSFPSRFYGVLSP